MVRSFDISEHELDQCHKGLMGGMIDADRERVLRSAEARSRFDYWSTQREKERDVVSMILNCQNTNNYVPDHWHTTQHDRYMLRRAIELSLDEDPVPQMASQLDVAPSAPAAAESSSI